MKVYKLSECAEIYSGSTPSTSNPEFWDGNIVWITPRDLSNLQSKYVNDSEKKITEEGYKSCSTKILPIGSVLLSSRAPIGHVAIAETELCTNQGFKSFIPKADLLCSDYLYYWLKANKDFLQNLGVGATFKEVSKSTLANVEIPLPPLEKQHRIVSILDKADDIRQKRQQAIAKLDELLQATFIDMFGDPLENSKKFPIKKLSEFYIDPKNGTKCGPFGSALKREEYTDSGIPVWSMDVLSLKGEFQDQPSLWISDEKYSKLEAYAVIDGDILISRAGTVGKMGVARSRFEKSIISTNLIRLRFGNLLLPDYFVSLMTFCKTRLPRLKTGADGAFTHMNTGILDNLEFPYPPIEIQNEYMKIYTNIHKQKEVLLNSASQFDDLFNALQQKAFNGTL